MWNTDILTNVTNIRLKANPWNIFWYLNFGWFVVASVGIFQWSPVAISQEALKSIFSFQFSNDLIKCLVKQNIIIQGKCRITDTREEGSICVLGTLRKGGWVPAMALCSPRNITEMKSQIAYVTDSELALLHGPDRYFYGKLQWTLQRKQNCIHW